MGHEPRERARSEIERRIVRGDLAGGARLDEEGLAAELEVEASAVREALAWLLADNLVREAPGGGFTVSAVDELELREGYPIALLLEGLAVRTGPPYSPQAVARLREINAQMEIEGAGDPLAAATHDHAFHEELVRNCGNEQLLETLRPLKRTLLRYEYTYMRAQRNVGDSVRRHAEICDHLERGDHQAAAAAVEANFRDSLPGLLEQL
jgi:DNA-binding GntR family transcriptional regulator